jgi:succinoglycan biosynthesis transport protein ExoP
VHGRNWRGSTRKAQDRRARLDQFRQRAGVVAERDDNEAVSINKGLTNALNNAIEKEAAASARLRAMTEAAAEGRMSSQGRQDATLASLEGKAHQVREDIREMERSFTPAFMEMDPKARAMRVRLTELERQIVQQRELGQTAALQAAREDLAGAQAQVARLREKQSAADRRWARCRRVCQRPRSSRTTWRRSRRRGATCWSAWPGSNPTSSAAWRKSTSSRRPC